MNARKVALITGSGKRRVGWHVADSLGKRGYRLAIHYRNSASEAQESVAEFQSRDIEAAAFGADLSDEQAVRSLVEQVLARIAKRHGIVEHLRHLGEISRNHAGADDEELHTRPVGLPQPLAVGVVFELVEDLDIPHTCRVRPQIDRTFDTSAPGQSIDDTTEFVDSGSGRGERLDRDVEMTTAWQAEPLGFLRGNAVTEELRAFGRELAAGELLEQIVLDTSARQGTRDVALAVAREQTADRARRRAPRGDDRREPTRLTRLEPRESAS